MATRKIKLSELTRIIRENINKKTIKSRKRVIKLTESQLKKIIENEIMKDGTNYMTFDDLEFSEKGSDQSAEMYFDNGFGVYVIKEYMDENDEGVIYSYNLAFLGSNGDFINDPRVTGENQEMIYFLDEDDVSELMRKIQNLPKDYYG